MLFQLFLRFINPFSLFFIITIDVDISMLVPVITNIAGVIIFSGIVVDDNIIPNI